MENSVAAAICKHFEQENLVCPVNLRKGFFTVGALDNIDHNPLVTTAQGLFHGTVISIFQFSTLTNHGSLHDSIVMSHAHHSDLFLYANVPAVSCKTDQLTVSECACDSLEAGKTDKAKWVEHGMQSLMKDEFVKEEYIIIMGCFSCFSISPPAIIALLPLFYEKAATIAMIKHGMDVQPCHALCHAMTVDTDIIVIIVGVFFIVGVFIELQRPKKISFFFHETEKWCQPVNA